MTLEKSLSFFFKFHFPQGFTRGSLDINIGRTALRESGFTQDLPRGRSSPLPSSFIDSRSHHDSIISPIDHRDKE